jgi:dTDP-4-amino-4,6-dideoxygalactose transaminase
MKQTPKSNIPVTQPYLPPLEEFMPYLKNIWENKWLTNNGAYHQTLEKELAAYLGVKHLSLFTNGTLALVTAIQALRLSGEVITTPFSFVATTHALWWNNIKPVFVDIDPDTLNLDAAKIEAAITPHTTAILPVHVFGMPCAVESIQQIADTYGLKVIYDACHAFGVKQRGISILNYGDMSILSFHATKVFTTFEGGAIISRDEASKKRIDFLKNFGFAGETTVVAPGINAKMNEFQSALGVLQLKHIDTVLQRRKELTMCYREALGNVPGIRLFHEVKDTSHNYAYFPILIDHNVFGRSRDDVYHALRDEGILARRYFYPLISQFPTYKGLDSASAENLPVAEAVTQKVLCLPLYPALEEKEIRQIAHVVKGKRS